METTYSLFERIDEPVTKTQDIYTHIEQCTHPKEYIDDINFFCNNCGMSVEPGFASLSCSSGLAQRFFCHSYVNSINERFNRFPKKINSKIRTSKTVTIKEPKKNEDTPLSELIEIQRNEIEAKYENDNIPLIDKISKIEKKKTSSQKDIECIKNIIDDCFSFNKSVFESILNGYAIYNTGKRKLAEPCPSSSCKISNKSSLIENWDVFIQKIMFLYKEYIELVTMLTPSNKRIRSKFHIEIYTVMLTYHILQFHLDCKTDDIGDKYYEINVDTLNDCFDLNRITVTKIRPSNPKSKVKTVICGLADRLGVGNSSLPRLIIESINFSLRFLKTPKFIEYKSMKYN